VLSLGIYVKLGRLLPNFFIVALPKIWIRQCLANVVTYATGSDKCGLLFVNN